MHSLTFPANFRKGARLRAGRCLILPDLFTEVRERVRIEGMVPLSSMSAIQPLLPSSM
jgi:hypothetical protein